MPRRELHFDIWQEITARICDEIQPEVLHESESLKALSLVCKSLVPLCQQHLFSTVKLESKRAEYARSARFRTVIKDNPALMSYIRVFQYQISNATHDNGDHETLELLSEHASIMHSISLHCEKDGREASRTPLRQAMEELILLPTLTHITLIGLKNLPSDVLGCCTHVAYLTLRNVDVVHLEFELEMDVPSPRPIRLEIQGPHRPLGPLCKSRVPNSEHKFIDFGGLKEIVAEFFDNPRPYNEGIQTEHILELLRITAALESLELSNLRPMRDRLLLDGFGAALSTHAISTLKRLSISVYNSVPRDRGAPLCGLVPELAIIARTNILHEISLRVDVRLDLQYYEHHLLRQFHEEDWDAFDRLLTAPGSFPKLRSVTVEIHYWASRSWNSEDVVDHMVNGRFVALSNSDAVEFRLSTERIV